MRVSIVPALCILAGCQPAPPQAAPAPAAEVVWRASESQMRADDLLREYRSDSVAADGRRDGKSVAVFGRVRQLDANLAGSSQLALDAGTGPDDRVGCAFDKPEGGTLVDVQPGDWVVVAGVGQSAARVEHCRLLRAFPGEAALRAWLRAAEQSRPADNVH